LAAAPHLIHHEARKVDLGGGQNLLFCCDCLDLLAKLDDDSLDLVYIDPPFCTQGHRKRGLDQAYLDQWPGGLDSYLEFLNPRLEQMRRILKATGTIFVHLDYRAVHYVKLALDRLFGYEHFLNEIIWSYRTGGVSKRWFSRKHQTILAYAKDSKRHKFHVQRNGQFRTDGLSYDEQGRPYKSTRRGRLYFDRRGPILTDVWEIPFLSTVGRERAGYPDQKPIKLLERIITSCTDPDDRVADFFVGSGTTVLAANRLGRRWLGCDINPNAIKLADRRAKAESVP
jgi:DNA modification methylase